jgi:Glutaminase/DcaP outer membrane protein
VTGKQVIDTPKVPSVLAVMSTAGLYDDSGKWLYHTGLPAKSGVGGGIIAVSPGKFGIAVISPPLDDAGNSVRAQRAIADISNALNGNPYAAKATSQSAQPKSTFEIYGFAMLDLGQDFTQINPNWFDTLRVTKLPRFEDEFGQDNSTFAGVRQTRVGVRSSTPTDYGDLKTQFEFELFGTGVDEGQTTFRLRHAYGELGAFLAGQTWSPFMDPDVFPNSLEYWGPTGMVFFRNVQLRWTPKQGEHTVMLALERPGASGDSGIYADRVELADITPRFPLPDFSGAYKYTQDWGYVRAAGLLRLIKWDDTLDDPFDLSGDATGWGINLSSNLKPTKNDTVRLQFVFGEGIQNYMNDSPVDIGVENNFSNPVTPIVGKPIPIVGIVAFLDHTWNESFTSSFGYSWQDNDNTDAQAPDAFRVGQYALGNLLYYPVPNVMVGGEFQWGRRENFSDGFSSDGVKVQFSFRYNFSWKLGG